MEIYLLLIRKPKKALSLRFYQSSVKSSNYVWGLFCLLGNFTERMMDFGVNSLNHAMIVSGHSPNTIVTLGENSTKNFISEFQQKLPHDTFPINHPKIFFFSFLHTFISKIFSNHNHSSSLLVLPIIHRRAMMSCFRLLSIILKNMYRKKIGRRKNSSRKRRKSMVRTTKPCAISTCSSLTFSLILSKFDTRLKRFASFFGDKTSIYELGKFWKLKLSSTGSIAYSSIFFRSLWFDPISSSTLRMSRSWGWST